MAQDAIANLVASLSHATTSVALANTLHQIKDAIIGHVQRKETAIRSGLAVALIAIIKTEHESDGLHNGDAALPLSDDEQNRIQATIILSSLATGGPRFVSPLLAAHADECLLNNLQSHHNVALVTASLRALKNLASSWSKAVSDESIPDTPPLNIITVATAVLFNDLLRQPHSPHAEKHVQLVCEILSFAAEHNDAKLILVDSDVLVTLASLLVSHSITYMDLKFQGDAHKLPSALPSQAIPKVLAAIRSIVLGSCHRGYRFIHTPCVRDFCAGFSNGEDDIRLMFARTSSNGSVTLLPQLHTPAQKSVSFHAHASFAALKSPNGRADHESGDTDHINAVVGWLLVFARRLRGSNQLIALHLAAIIVDAVQEAAVLTMQPLNIQKTRERERQLAVLAVPLVVRLIQYSLDNKSEHGDLQKREEDRLIREQACEVLHVLIKHNKDLEDAAVDAGATKYVCSLLRQSFESIATAKPMWSPSTASTYDDTSSTRLGPPGLPSEVTHIMKCRLGALHALASLADKDDAHRKAIVDANVVPCLIEALKPLSESNLSAASVRGVRRPIEGNSTEVVLAACRAAQHMSRSAAILRTSLIDVGIVKPITDLLHHPRLEMQIAATDVCANLGLDFSPMRHDLLHLGVGKTLCKNARNGSSALRLSSLWALKHIILKAPTDIRISMLTELDAEWLMRAIVGDQSENYTTIQGGGVTLKGTNAAGEQTDILNPTSMDVDDPDGDATGQDDYADEDGELLYDEASKTHYQSSSMRSTLQTQTSNVGVQRQLANIRNAEQHPALQAKRDDIAIQEQALDFVRNFLHGEACAAVIDHLFSKIGQTKLLAILTAKIAPLPDRQRTTRASRSSSRPVYYPTEIMLSALHVITHLANGNNFHKEAIIANRPLIQAILPHFNHPSPEIRVSIVWTVNSLTWVDEQSDQSAARRRLHDLRRYGFETELRKLALDGELDIRERVKVAIRQFESM